MLGYNLITTGRHALVIKQHPIVKTPSAWDEHDLPWSIQIQGVFHRRHCLKVRACLLSLWIWNVKWLGIFLSERSKDTDPVYLVLPSRRDWLFCEIRRNKRYWLNPGFHTCGNDMRAW